MSENTYGGASERQGHLRLYAAVFFCFLAIYAATAQRGVGWQDSGEFQYRVLAGDYHWFSGIARAHPLYIFAARGFVALFPRAACFYALNLFSGLGMAVALALVAACVARLTRSARAAAASVVLLGFAHMAWWMGTIAEVYTWSLALLLAEVYCLARYFERGTNGWLIALFGVNGAHFSVHNFALLGLPVYGVLLLWAAAKSRRGGGVLLVAAAGVWCLAGGLTLGQAAALLRETGSPVAVIKSVLFGDGYERQVLGSGVFDVRVWGANVVLAGLSFINPCWLWSAAGLFRAPRAGVWRCLFILTALHAVFWARYFVPDQATFVLPTLGLLSVWAGLGIASVKKLAGGRQAVLVGCGALCAVAGPWLVGTAGEKGLLEVRRSRGVPFRSELAYWARPWKHAEDSAERFVAAVETKLPAGTVLVADTTVAGPLMAARAAGRSAGEWRLVTPWSRVPDAELQAWVSDAGRAVYVVSPVRGYMPHVLESTNAVFTPDGVLYRVQWSQALR